MQGAIEETDLSGGSRAALDVVHTAKGRAAIHIAVDDRKSRPWVVRGIGCLRPDVDDNITRSVGGHAKAAAEHFSDMSGIFTHLAAKQIDTRNTAGRRLMVIVTNIALSHQLIAQIHFAFIRIGIVAVAASIDVSKHIAARDNNERGVLHHAADVAAAEEFSSSRDWRTAFHENQAVVVYIVHAAAAVNGIAHHGIRCDHRSIRSWLVRAAQAHHTAHIAVGVAANGEIFARGHSASVATAINGTHLAMQQDDVRYQGYIFKLHDIIFVVAAEDSAHMVVCNRIFDVEEHRDTAIHSHAVTTAIHRINMTAIGAVIVVACNVDVNESVGLDRFVIELSLVIF